MREEQRTSRDSLPRGIPAVGCVVMASGLGRRFQREGAPWQDKLLADFLGKPLIGHVLDLTETAPLAARTVVTRSEGTAAYCRGRGVDVVLHDQPGRGDAVRLGLERVQALSPEPLAGCLFCLGDQPLLRGESLLSLLASFAGAPERIHRLCRMEAGEPVPGNPVLFPAGLFEELKALPEGKGGSFLVKKYPGQVVYVPVRDELELMDVDTREQLEQLAALAAGER